ncbi:MAG TPA: extracellular solute-binding protein [Jiangellaceae bacterium]
MRGTTRRKAITGAVAVLALTLSACGGDEGEEPDQDAGDEEPDDEDGGEGGDDPLADQSVGAMDEWGVGDTFVATEPVEFGLLYRDHPNYPYQEDWLILETLEQEHNVTFDTVNVPLSDWNDRRNLLLGAGDAPELVPSIYAGDEDQFVAGGALLPVSDYLDYLPNFWDKVQKWGLEAEIDNLRQEDGKFYILPGLHELNNPQYTFAYRADLFEEAGITEQPATWDEWADQLETVVEFHDLDYGITDGADNFQVLDATLSVAGPNFGTQGGWTWYGREGVWHNGEQFEYVPAMDEYRDMIAYFADLNDRGLLDPESINQDKDQSDQKFLNGNAAARGSNYQEIVNLRQSFEDLGEDVELELLTVPTGPAGSNLNSGERLESGIVISAHAAESDHFKALLQYVDWQYFGDTGLEFAKWGVEGETYTKEDDGTRVLAESVDWGGLNPGAPEQLNADYGFYNGVWTLAHGSTADLFLSMHREETQEFITKMNEKEELPLPPPAPLTEEEQERAQLLRGTLESHAQENTAQFILGQRSLDEWDDYVAELEGLGMSDYVTLYNEAANR